MTDYNDESCADSPTCPNGFALDFDGKHCVWSCESGKRTFDKVAGEYVCVENCSGYAPILNKGTCVTCASRDLTKPVWDASANDCRACKTADGGVRWDSVNEKCVDECPDAAPVFVEEQGVCRKC